MATRLRFGVINRIDLVDKGANQESYIVLIKRADSMEKNGEEYEQPPLTTGEIVAQQDAMERLCRIKGAMAESLYRIFEHAPLAEQPQLLMQSVQEFAAFARQAIAQLDGGMAKGAALLDELEAIAKVGRKISATRMRRLKEVLAQIEAILLEAEPMATAEEKGTEKRLEELQAKVDKAALETLEAKHQVVLKRLDEDLTVLKQANAGLTAENTALKAEKATLEDALQVQKDATDPEAMWKGVNPQVRKQFEDMQRKTTEAEAVAKSERDAREKQEYIQKVNSFKNLILNPDDDWELFKALNRLDPKATLRLETILKAADEALRQSLLFASLGHSGSGEHTGTAFTTITARAQELVNKGLAKTVEQGFDQVIQTDPALYHQYEQERRGR